MHASMHVPKLGFMPNFKFIDQKCLLRATHLKFYIVLYYGAPGQKMTFGHNFWPGGPIDEWSTLLNCILQDLFRDTPLDHFKRPNVHIWPNILVGDFFCCGGNICFWSETMLVSDWDYCCENIFFLIIFICLQAASRVATRGSGGLCVNKPLLDEKGPQF